MHENGLQMGIYANFGTRTCMGFPGTNESSMRTDAQTFADWGADMLKFDGCFTDPGIMDHGDVFFFFWRKR